MNSVQLLKTALPNFFKHDVQEPVPDRLPPRASVFQACLDSLFVADSRRRESQRHDPQRHDPQRDPCNRQYSFIEEACWPVD